MQTSIVLPNELLRPILAAVQNSILNLADEKNGQKKRTGLIMFEHQIAEQLKHGYDLLMTVETNDFDLVLSVIEKIYLEMEKTTKKINALCQKNSFRGSLLDMLVQPQ